MRLQASSTTVSRPRAMVSHDRRMHLAIGNGNALPLGRCKLTRWFASSALLVALSLSSGCVAIGVPSQRFQDPDDHGGLLGDWRHGKSGHAAGLEHASAVEGCLACDSEPLPPMELDENGIPYSESKSQAPEVPWPRFHPVPTRPVYGAPRPVNLMAEAMPQPRP